MRSIIIAIFVCFAAMLFATDVSGIQSGNWDIENSPYVVVGNVTIPQGETLTIDPGVNVQFNGPYQIESLGMLVAQGTVEDSIYFDRHPAYSGYWDEIRLEQEDVEYEISYCIIRGAETGINSIDAPLHLHHCHLESNTKGVHLFAIGNPDPPEVLIEYCLIENSVENGIDIYENGNAVIENCEITGNGTGTQYRGAIQINIQSTGVYCAPIIQYNQIHHNLKQGITCTDMFSAGVINAYIRENVIESNLTGIYFYNCGGRAIDNQISDNFIPGDMNSGAGIMCYGSLATPFIAQNTITGNYTALYIVNSANPCLGDITGTTPPEIGENIFQNNIDANGNNNSIYVYNCSNTYTIKAENNSWDSEDYDEIAGTIYDHVDNPSLPAVDFDPLYELPEPMLSGTLSCSQTQEITTIMVRLLPADSLLNEVIDTAICELGEYHFYDIPPGHYFVSAQGYDMEDRMIIYSGSYGDWRFPEILSFSEDTSYTDIDIELVERDRYNYQYVPRTEQSGTRTLYHYVTGWLYPEKQFLLYKEGDYMYYWGIPLYDESGWYSQEFEEPHPIFQKIENIQPGDSWPGRYYYQDINPVEAVCTVTAIDSIDYFDDTLEEITTEVTINDLILQQKFTRKIGNTYTAILDSMELMAQYLSIDMELSELPAADSSYWPLCQDYYNISMGVYDEIAHPWNLNFAWREDDTPILLWNPASCSTDWQSYRIYANNALLAEISVDNQQLDIPLPLEEDTEFYVTAYEGTYESEPSNTITWQVMTPDDISEIIPPATELQQNYPNPFSTGASRGTTAISFFLKERSPAKLTVYNARGQKITELINETLSAGTHAVIWDGLNSNNQPAAAGMYFYELTTPTATMAKKLILLR